jgi:hypothetical protein
MLGYIQDHRLDIAIEGLHAPTDACPEVWLRDVGEIERLQNSPEYLQGAHPDEANFMNGPARALISRETVLIPGAGRRSLGAAVKLMLFFKRKADLTQPAFAEWTELPHPLLMPDAKPLRLARDTAIDDHVIAEAQAYDGMEVSW